jgi:hypothetical protein
MYSNPDSSGHGQVRNTVDDELTTPERFELFHAANPHVYHTLVKLSRRFIDSTGQRRLAIQRVVEIARWDMQIATRGAEEFVINNSFTPYYARLIMLQEPDLTGVYEIRKSAEADSWAAAQKVLTARGHRSAA